MFTIFNGRQRQADGDQPRIYAQLDVTLRAHIADFKQQNSLNPFAVFIAIALHTNEYGWGWPTTETLKKETGLTSDRTIYAIVAFLRDMKLEGKRVLDQYRIYEGGKWGASYYHIFPEAGGADKLPDKRLQLWGKKTHYHAKKEPVAPPVVVQQVDTTICRGTTYGSHAGLFKDNHSEEDQNNSLGVPNELAENASTRLSADTALKANLPHLNTDERKAMKHLLQAVQNGRVVESAYNPKIVRYLLELGEIERCDIGLYPGLCLKGSAAPTHITRADEKGDPAVDQFNAELAKEFAPINGNRQSFLDGSSPRVRMYDHPGDGEYHWVLPGQTIALCGATVTPEWSETMPWGQFAPCCVCNKIHPFSSNGQSPTDNPAPTPRETPVAPALPEVPEGYAVAFSEECRHYITPSRKTALCGVPRAHLTGLKNKIFGRQCPDCAARAATPKAGRKVERDPLFKAVATGIMGYAPENGTQYTKGQCQLINSVKGAIMRVMNLQKNDADYQKGADGIPLYKKHFKGKHPNLDYPTHASFEGYFKEWFDAEGVKGGKLPQGDFSEPVWIDRLFVKRENGKLYCRPQVGEWREAVASEVERWS